MGSLRWPGEAELRHLLFFILFYFKELGCNGKQRITFTTVDNCNSSRGCLIALGLEFSHGAIASVPTFQLLFVSHPSIPLIPWQSSLELGRHAALRRAASVFIFVGWGKAAGLSFF